MDRSQNTHRSSNANHSRGRKTDPYSDQDYAQNPNYGGQGDGRGGSNGPGFASRFFPSLTTNPNTSIQSSSYQNGSRGGCSDESKTDKIHRLRSQRDEAEKRVDELEKERKQLIEAVNQKEDALKRFRQAMEDKELFIGPQAIDRIISTRFVSLFKNVRTWSRYLTGEMIEPSTINGYILTEFLSIAPAANEAALSELLTNKSTRRFIIQGWVCLLMAKWIFPALEDGRYAGNEAQDLWLEADDAECLWKLERVMDRKVMTPRDFNDWRAYSASLLSKSDSSVELPDSTNVRLIKLCETVLETVGGWSSTPTEREAMASELMAIFTEAVQLSRLMRTQRAQWSIRFPMSHNAVGNESGHQHQDLVTFDSATMKSVEPQDEDERTDNKVINIFVTPALFKRGNTDGEKFDVCSAIELSGIMWKEVKKTIAPPLHTTKPQQYQGQPTQPNPSQPISQAEAPPIPEKPKILRRPTNQIVEQQNQDMDIDEPDYGKDDSDHEVPNDAVPPQHKELNGEEAKSKMNLRRGGHKLKESFKGLKK